MDNTKRRAERTILEELVMLIPNLVRLLFGLLRDRRVKWQEKAVLLTTLLYVFSPIDMMPDFIPFFGQVDDILLLSLVVLRFIEQAGRDVVMEHWAGSRNLLQLVREVMRLASLFLPRGVYEKVVKSSGYRGDVIDVQYRIE